MERLDLRTSKYDPVEASIHLARYISTRGYLSGKRVLDAACGEGYGSALMKHWGAESVVGVDISADAVQKAKKMFPEENLDFLEHNIECLPFDDVSFDMAVSFETIEHLNKPESFLLELRRVVKAGGTIVLSCPNDQYYAENIPSFSNPFHKRRYNYFEFREVTESILGNNAKWYLGNAIAGFFNMPVENSNCPETGIPEAPNSMLGLMEARMMSNVYLLPPSKYLNHWNCLYYLGIWGTQGIQDTASLYPTPHFFLYQNKNIPDNAKYAQELQTEYSILEDKYKETENEICEIKSAYKELKNDYNNTQTFLDDLSVELSETAEKNHNLNNEIERVYLLNDMQKKEEVLLREQIQKWQEENKSLVEINSSLHIELSETKEENRILNNERERLYLLNDMQKKEEVLLWEQIQRLREENKSLADLNNEMKNTRGWRALEILRKVLIFFGWRKH